MISWTDVVKLCVPFVFSLALIWTRSWYIERRERIAKQGALWRLILEDSGYLMEAFTKFDQIVKAANEGHVRLIHFEVSWTPVEFARRLAELDPRHAYIYSAYAARSNIVVKGLDCLMSLLQQFIAAEQGSSSRVLEALRGQVMSLKTDIVKQAEAELRILEFLAEKVGEIDKQRISGVAKSIEAAREQARLAA